MALPAPARPRFEGGLAGRLTRLPVRRPGVAEAACWLAAAGLVAATVGWPGLGGSQYDAVERQAASVLARRTLPPAAGPEGARAIRLSASAAP